MADPAYSIFNALVDIVAAPGKAFDEIRLHTSWLWTPLFITILLAVGLLVYYFNWVDFSWLVEETIRQVPSEGRAESADVIRQFMQPQRSAAISAIAVLVTVLVVYLLQAVYLHLANKVVTRSQIGLGQWVSFSVWTGFVAVFGTLAAFIAILLADSNQTSLEDLQVFSINSLLVHAAPGEPWHRWGSSLTLVQFWTLALMSIGYARWTGAAPMKSTLIVSLPWVAIFGIWAATI